MVHYEVYENYSELVSYWCASNVHIQWFGNPDYGHQVIPVFNYLGTRRNILLLAVLIVPGRVYYRVTVV